MSEFRQVTDAFSVAPQIKVQDIARAAADGFVLVVNNRPDGESPDEAQGGEIEAATRAAGMDYLYLPVVGGPTPDQAQAMAEAIEDAGGPVLAYCRSGTRSINTWALGQALAGARPRDELVRLGAAAGYDLRPMLG